MFLRNDPFLNQDATKTDTTMKFTFYGHACFSLEVAGKTLLFDPFISGNPQAAEKINLEEIKADYILITHGHGDHIADAVQLAKQTGATCISTFEIIQWLGKQGVENGHPMNTGGKWRFDFGTVKFVHAFHSSSFPDGSYAGHPGGFIIESSEATFYFAGDTALMRDMRRWGRDYEFDFVILPVGDNFTMGYDDAARAAKWLKAEVAVGVHFDTFPYIEIDHQAAKAAFREVGCKLILPEIGSSEDL